MSSNSCEHVSRRVQKTKKEIEQLKEELQKLICKGVESQSSSQEHNEPSKTKHNDEKWQETEKAQISPQPHLTSARANSLRNVTFRTNFSVQQSDATKRESPKKVRHYNVEEAREYIRKQKEKRLNKMKSEIKDTRNVVDLRKEKLRELQKKSLELVQKNINLKRERSRSRDKGKLEDDNKIDKNERLKHNKLYGNRTKSNDQAIKTQRKAISAQHEGNNVDDEEIVTKSSNDNLSLNNNLVPDLIVNNFKHVVDKVSNQQVDIQNSILNEQDAAIKIQRYYRKYHQKKLKQNHQKIISTHHELIAHLQHVPCVPKITQTVFDVPIWLTPKVESYPYNFINTVKRKLNFAINNQSQNKDVGTQIDFNSSKEQVSKIKEDIKRSLDESKRKEKENDDLRVFLSQKCLDLDLRKVENLNLFDKKGCDKKHSISDSESDTSKNIPDISTESVSKNSVKTLSDIKTSSNLNLQININKIKDLKLEENFEKSHEMNFVEKFGSKSAENITKRSKQKTQSRSASSMTSIKNTKKDPSPLQVPNINLIASEPPTEDTNNDLKNFLDYMSNLDYKKHSKSKTDSFVSLPPTSTKSDTVKTEFSTQATRKSDKKGDSYSSYFSEATADGTSVPSLKRPTITLSTSQKVGKSEATNNLNQVSIKPGEVKCIETKSNTNQIHLKFEAELHLLNDFNESLRQFMAVEKTILDLHSKNQNSSIVLQNQDTQTSAQIEEQLSAIEDSLPVSAGDEESTSESKHPEAQNINFSRGSDIGEEFSQLIKDDMRSTKLKKERSLISVSLDLSQLDDTINSTVDESIPNTSAKINESCSKNAFAGFSVGMFDQLIRDEDTRIENLKTILKIREKALLDRTKGELAWLEIQKKQLIETGQLHEASLLKKKQRGIIIKLQHEKQEMQRLKQIQKQASKERKTVLKEQRNMIKAQLSNNCTIPKIKRSVQKEKRKSGPVKVYNLHRETINTETSISRRNSIAEEIIITSRSESVVGQITEDYSADQDSLLNSSARSILSKGTEDAKKSLLMREAALQKRKKAAEELLRWHQRLLEEERKIAELEMAANTIIKQAPSFINNQGAAEDHHQFKGSQLNLLWLNMTGRKEKKFIESEHYTLSSIALEKFCKEAKKAATKTEKLKHSSDTSIITEDSVETKHSKKSTESIHSVKTDSPEIPEKSHSPKENSYSSDFDLQIMEVSENESLHKKEVKTGGLENEIDKSKSTLNEIMQNISNITDEISAIYKLSTAANVNEPSVANESTKTSEVSVRTQSKPISVTNNNILSDNQVMTSIENKTLSDQKLKVCSENNSFNYLDDQINKILSEGTKRINSILNSRTQKISKAGSKICDRNDDSENLIKTDISVIQSTNRPNADDTEKIDSLKTSEIFSDKVNVYNQINKSKSETTEHGKNTTEIFTENNIETMVSNDTLMDRNSHSLFNKSSEITSDTIVNKSDNIELSDSTKSKSISVTVLKSNEIPKLNLLSSSVTLVKNLTELIKTGTESVSTPESKNTSVDSPCTLSCNGELLSASNELKVETNDGSENTSDDRCQIADIFSKELAADNAYLEIAESVHEKIYDTDIQEGNLLQTENNVDIIEIKADPNADDDKTKLQIENEEGMLKVLRFEDKNNLLNKSITDNSITSKIIGTNTIKSHDNTELSNLEPATEISSEIDYEKNILKSLLTLNGELEKSLQKQTVPTSIATIKSKETSLENHGQSKDAPDLNKRDGSKLLNVNTMTTQRNSQLLDENRLEKSRSDNIEVINYRDKSSTLSDISSIKDEASVHSQSNLTSKKVIFKPLKTLDDSNNSLNYSIFNGHDVKWEEEITNLQNKFETLTIGNQNNSQSKIISEHSKNNDTLATTDDVVSILSDKEESVVGQYASKRTLNADLNATIVLKDIPEELSKQTATEDETNASISISELSQCKKFQDNRDSNDKKISTSSSNSSSQLPREELSTRTELVEKSDDNGEIISEEKSEVKSGEKSEIKSEETNDLTSVQGSETKCEENSGTKSVEKNLTKSLEKSETKSESRSELNEAKLKSLGDAVDFVDVKKRVSEILADANSPRGDKSPRLQDIYTTTYDILSPDRSPEMVSPVNNEKDLASVTQMYGEEAEALFKKQLAIEQEIKQLEQQQKEQIPYMYMREIPNKPPPPYTPPISQSHTATAVPASAEQLDTIVCNVARILHNSYYKGTLETIVLTDRDKKTFSLRNSNIDKECYEYVFDLCKELAVEHYRQFVDKPEPSWLKINKRHLARRKPFNESELHQHLFKEITVLLGFEKDPLNESIIAKWCRKKRDHVDEILIVESQTEESEWTNYDKDELMVKDELTNDIMKILMAETAQVLNKILKKRLAQSPS